MCGCNSTACMGKLAALAPIAYSELGAPRPMKMGTIRSLCPYDAAARDTLQSQNLRRPAILRYAPRTVVIPISQGGPRFPLGDPAS
jgi:hypothetical protein